MQNKKTNITNYEYHSSYNFPTKYMDNEGYIQKRITKANLKNKIKEETFENILKFLYFTEYDHLIHRKTLKNYENLLEVSEKLMAYRLQTRCTGRLKKRYGIDSVIAFKRAKYECKVCGIKDVRCLEIDHVQGKSKNKTSYKVIDFQVLCANHHRIKTIVEKQQN